MLSSPSKPWEKTSAQSSSSAPAAYSAAPKNSRSSATSTELLPAATQPPALPPRPPGLDAVISNPASNYSSYNAASPLSVSPFTGINNYNNYASPYSRFGPMSNSLYGGLGGGYGGMYGGVGGRYGGIGRPGIMGLDPNDPSSLVNSISESTQATLQIVGNFVSAFGGFAQLLDSAYMTTHSSIIALASVAEQFRSFRTSLGSILGIFALLRYLRTLFAKITGRPPPSDAPKLTPESFTAWLARSSSATSSTEPPSPSKKSFLVLMLVVLGIPYLTSKLVRSLTSSQSQPHPQNGVVLGPDGTPLPDQQPFDPLKLEFCRALYTYDPITNRDLPVKKGDIVVVLSKNDTSGQPSEWWHCRARDGRSGWVPGSFLEVIKRRGELDRVPAGKAMSTAHSVDVEGRSASSDV